MAPTRNSLCQWAHRLIPSYSHYEWRRPFASTVYLRFQNLRKWIASGEIMCYLWWGGWNQFQFTAFFSRKSKYETKTQVQLGSVIYISVFELNDNKPKACACYYAKNHFIWRRRAKNVEYRIGGFGSGSTISIATWHRKREKLNSNRDVISRILFWGCSGWWRKILGILCYFKFDEDSINVISRRPSPKPKQLTKPMKLPRIFDLHCVCARCLLTFIRIGKSIYTCVCAIYYVKPFYVLIPISLKRERIDSERQRGGG